MGYYADMLGSLRNSFRIGKTTLDAAGVSTARTLTVPDKSGTIACLSDIPYDLTLSTPSRALVTSTSATGFQLSSTRRVQVSYEGSFSTTSTISSPSGGSIFLEIANTNSTTPGDWTVVAQQSVADAVALAAVLQHTMTIPWAVSRTIETGKWVRIRSLVTNGTITFSINSMQQEVVF